MLNIAVICAGGISTSFLVNNMRKAIKDRKLDVKVEAYAGSMLTDVIKAVDIVLIAPQARYFESTVAELCRTHHKLYEPLEGSVYMGLNGEAALDQALLLAKKAK